MANLDNLTDRILKEARTQADAILLEGKKKAEEARDRILKEAEGKRQAILRSAQTDAALLKDRMTSSDSLSFRDEKLKAKGEVIDKVMERVRESLKSMTPERLKEYMASTIDKEKLTPGTRILVAPEYLDMVKGEYPGFEAVADSKVSGFILDKDGIMENYSFDRLLDFKKEDLEEQLAQYLFEGR